MSTLLTTKDVATLIATRTLPRCLEDLAGRIRADFLRWPEFDKSARLASHSRLGVIELMPVADARYYSFKYVNGHPQNPHIGLPTVMALGVLADVATGIPLLVSELTLTTALRTAAMSAVAAQALARPGARSVALIGNGAQSEFRPWPSITCWASTTSAPTTWIPPPPASWPPIWRGFPACACGPAPARPKRRAAPTSSPRSRRTRPTPPSSPPTWWKTACT